MPTRLADSLVGSYSRFCSPQGGYRHLSRPLRCFVFQTAARRNIQRPAASGLAGVICLHRRGCDETEPSGDHQDRPCAQPTHLAPGRTLAQPAALLLTAGRLLPYRFSPYLVSLPVK
jgi:hypothetical protein